jgi:hypothetical protein
MQAIQAAQVAQTGPLAQIEQAEPIAGSSEAAQGSGLWGIEAIIRTASPRGHEQVLRTGSELPQGLLWATWRAARNCGRPPAEVWAEALRNWLTIQALTEEERDGRSAPAYLDARRAQAWQAIDATLSELKAS